MAALVSEGKREDGLDFFRADRFRTGRFNCDKYDCSIVR